MRDLRSYLQESRGEKGETEEDVREIAQHYSAGGKKERLRCRTSRPKILALMLLILARFLPPFPFFFPPKNASRCDLHGSDVHAVGIADLRPALFGIICASCGVW